MFFVLSLYHLFNYCSSWLEENGFGNLDVFRGPRLVASDVLLTPLGAAAKCGDVNLCIWLYNHGADPDAYLGNNFNGNTPMHLACLYGQLKVCQVIVSFYFTINKLINLLFCLDL